MSRSYYAQSPNRCSTMTVQELIDALMMMPDRDAPVIFRSPRNGAFGSLHAYSVDDVTPQSIEAETIHVPAQTHIDDETGEESVSEAYDDELLAWSGVVIE